MIEIRTVAFSVVLRQYAFPKLKRLCFQTKNLSTDRKQVYEIKFNLKYILKGNFLCVKTFQPITAVLNEDNKSFQFSSVPTHRITVVFRLGRDLVERKIVDQLRKNKYTAT